mmetsp:Transcript_21605/g.46201  ORF Transcript_21605/g.46201 Transcript_21605/m.46201 type:complete len:546 (+) Transcript_21605:193-1830(+)
MGLSQSSMNHLNQLGISADQLPNLFRNSSSSSEAELRHYKSELERLNAQLELLEQENAHLKDAAAIANLQLGSPGENEGSPAARGLAPAAAAAAAGLQATPSRLGTADTLSGGTLVPGFLTTLCVDEVDEILCDHKATARGNFGQYRKGRATGVVPDLAVKASEGSDWQERLLSELRVQATVKSRHLVLLHAVCPARLVLAYPWAPFGSVQDQLVLAPPAAEVALDWLAGACRGLQALHDHGLVHSDIRSSKILLFVPGSSSGAAQQQRNSETPQISSAVARLGGCGTVREESQPGNVRENSRITSVGCQPYLDPWTLSTKRPPSRLSDMFAMGVVLLELMVGRPADFSRVFKDRPTDATQTRRLRPKKLWQQFDEVARRQQDRDGNFPGGESQMRAAVLEALRKMLPKEEWANDAAEELGLLLLELFETKPSANGQHLQSTIPYAVPPEEVERSNVPPRPMTHEVLERLEEARALQEASRAAPRERICVICMDEQVNSKLRPCNHAVLCVNCAKLCIREREKCPICRSSILRFERGTFEQTFAF